MYQSGSLNKCEPPRQGRPPLLDTQARASVSQQSSKRTKPAVHDRVISAVENEFRPEGKPAPSPATGSSDRSDLGSTIAPTGEHHTHMHLCEKHPPWCSLSIDIVLKWISAGVRHLLASVFVIVRGGLVDARILIEAANQGLAPCVHCVFGPIQDS